MVAVLLDTNVLYWWATGTGRLGSRAEATLGKADRIHLSVVSFWELATKVAVGKMRVDVLDLAGQALATTLLLTVTTEHCLRYSRLPLHHRDPFDRMLVAQSLHESLTLLIGDRRMADYTADLILCG